MDTPDRPRSEWIHAGTPSSWARQSRRNSASDRQGAISSASHRSRLPRPVGDSTPYRSSPVPRPAKRFSPAPVDAPHTRVEDDDDEDGDESFNYIPPTFEKLHGDHAAEETARSTESPAEDELLEEPEPSEEVEALPDATAFRIPSPEPVSEAVERTMSRRGSRRESRRHSRRESRASVRLAPEVSVQNKPSPVPSSSGSSRWSGSERNAEVYAAYAGTDMGTSPESSPKTSSVLARKQPPPPPEAFSPESEKEEPTNGEDGADEGSDGFPTQYAAYSPTEDKYGTPEMPRGTAKLPHLPPEELQPRVAPAQLGRGRDHREAKHLPRAEKLPLTGYELLAQQIGASIEEHHPHAEDGDGEDSADAPAGSGPTGPRRSAPKPIYRAFKQLQHRTLLHLQDLIAEDSEILHRLDTADSQTRRQQNGFLPASRRQENLMGGELQAHKTDVMGRIASRLAQYNQLLTSLTEIQSLPTPALADVEGYRAYLSAESPIAELETRFLDNADDLVWIGPRRRAYSTSTHRSVGRRSSMVAHFAQEDAVGPRDDRRDTSGRHMETQTHWEEPAGYQNAAGGLAEQGTAVELDASPEAARLPPEHYSPPGDSEPVGLSTEEPSTKDSHPGAGPGRLGLVAVSLPLVALCVAFVAGSSLAAW